MEGTMTLELRDDELWAIQAGGAARVATFSGGGAVDTWLEPIVRAVNTRDQLLAALYQYRDDMRFPPTDDSRERRIEMIDAALAAAGVEGDPGLALTTGHSNVVIGRGRADEPEDEEDDWDGVVRPERENPDAHDPAGDEVLRESDGELEL
jgi:hypothetical protein